MHYSFKSTRWMRSILVGGAVISLALSVFAAEPKHALLMSKTDKSLLLDIQRKGDQLVAVGERGHIIFSSDHGKTWVQSPVPTAQMLTAVYFANELQGWAVGHDGNIVNTVDGGKTWSLQRDGLQAQVERNREALRAAVAEVNRLQNMINAGETAAADAEWTLEEQLEEAEWSVKSARERLHSVAVAPPLMDVWFEDAKNGWAVGSFGLLLQTQDGGETWIERSSDLDNADGYHLNSVVGTNDVIYVAGEAGFLSISRDQGQSWELVDLDYDGSLFGIFAAPQGEYVVATGLRGNTFITNDNGASWQLLEPDAGYSLASGFAIDAKQFILVGAGGAIVLTRDGGETFENFTLPSRASLSSVVALDQGQFILVGQGGVHRFNVNATTK